MDPVTGAIIAGGLQLGASYLSSRGQAAGQEQTNAFNAAEAQKNRDFQERMYRYRHTYEVEDLLRAGLNPVLSAKYGGGNVPTGAQATFNNPKGHYAETAIATARNLKELTLIESAISKNKADANRSNAEAMRARGLVSIPGIGQIPIERAQEMYQDYMRSQTNANSSKSFSRVGS
jgi:hypothetical protein